MSVRDDEVGFSSVSEEADRGDERGSERVECPRDFIVSSRMNCPPPEDSTSRTLACSLLCPLSHPLEHQLTHFLLTAKHAMTVQMSRMVM